MHARPTRRRDEDRGASAVEYGLMVAAIAAVLVGVVFGLGGLVRDTFDKTCSALASQVQPGCVVKGDTGGQGTGTTTDTNTGTDPDPAAGTDTTDPGVDPGPGGLPAGG